MEAGLAFSQVVKLLARMPALPIRASSTSSSSSRLCVVWEAAGMFTWDAWIESFQSL